MGKQKGYNVDISYTVREYETIYVGADSPEEAREIAEDMYGGEDDFEVLEVEAEYGNDVQGN